MVSTYLAQHAAYDAPAIDGEHFRPYWRRHERTRLDDLRDEKAISPRVYLAAILYRDLIARATASAWGTRPVEVIDRSTRGDPVSGAGSATAQLHRTRAQLGAFAARLVDLVVVLDLPWNELGRRYRVDPKTIKRYAVTTLQLLAQIMG